MAERQRDGESTAQRVLLRNPDGEAYAWADELEPDYSAGLRSV